MWQDDIWIAISMSDKKSINKSGKNVTAEIVAVNVLHLLRSRKNAWMCSAANHVYQKADNFTSNVRGNTQITSVVSS